MTCNMKNFRSKKINNIQTPSSGFTLLETIVAIGILSLAATAPIVIAQKGIASAIYARDQITAFYLAQEAIEYIRNVRDTNRLNNDTWLKNLNPCEGPASKRCQLDLVSNDLKNCPKGSKQETDMWCAPISFSPSLKMYNQPSGAGGDWIAAKFSRDILIDEVDAATKDREQVITVIIRWQPSAFSVVREFKVKSHIFDIK